MAKASSIYTSFNGGVFSPLMEGRIDLDRYPSSLRQCSNFVAAPQGPILRRSGTRFMQPIFDETKGVKLIPFVFNETQVYNLEFGDKTLRFINDDGVLVRTPKAVTAVTNDTITIPAHGYAVADQIALAGFPVELSINGTTAKVLAILDINNVRVDRDLGAIPAPPATASAAQVYKIATPYAAADVGNLRVEQSVDVLFIWCVGYRPKKLARNALFDWQFSNFAESDGPYLPINDKSTKLTPDSSGNSIPYMTSNTAPSGTAADGTATANAWRAFADPNDTATAAWQGPAGGQVGTLGYLYVSPQTPNGYVIYASRENGDATYAALDYAPASWIVEGQVVGSSATSDINDGVWEMLDTQTNYVLWDNYRSVFFKIKNTTPYSGIRIRILSAKRNGTLAPKIRRFAVATAGAAVNFFADKTDNINKGRGFLSTDVGRVIRFQCADNAWRALTIIAVASTTQFTATLQGEPLAGVQNSTNWRLGYWSDTTGWPNTGAFYEDRLFQGGSTEYPDLVVGSVSSDYENYQQTDYIGTVLATNAIVVRLNARRLSRISWIKAHQKGLVIGTGSQEWVIGAADQTSGMAANNIKATPTTAQGSASIQPVNLDQDVVFVQRSRRTLRKLTYQEQLDGFRSPSLSLFASHMGSGTRRFSQIEYAQEPYSIIWIRRADGTIAGLTLNSDENVNGFHEHDVGGFVEDINVLPTADGLQDVLWLVVRRTINGQTRRYIERLTNFWDFDSTLDTAHFVDCGLRYQGAPVAVVYGLGHLEGETVCGLADGSPFAGKVVQNASIALASNASNIVVGKGYDGIVETSRLNSGAADGTAQGKNKRITNTVTRIWQSGSFQIGRRKIDSDLLNQADITKMDYLFENILARKSSDPVTKALDLLTLDYGPIKYPDGYDKEGTVVIKPFADVALPVNIIAVMPQVVTQDR